MEKSAPFPAACFAGLCLAGFYLAGAAPLAAAGHQRPRRHGLRSFRHHQLRHRPAASAATRSAPPPATSATSRSTGATTAAAAAPAPPTTTTRRSPRTCTGSRTAASSRSAPAGSNTASPRSTDSAPGCGAGSCVQPPLGGNQLGVGCTDPYGSGLNGSRPLGRKSEVDATTGAYPFPYGGGGSTTAVWNQRVAVAEADLDAALNPGAVYYIEGQYVAPDDALSGNGLNNASYRRVTVTAGTFNLVMAASTVRRKSAIEVWPTVDSTVELINLDTPSTPDPTVPRRPQGDRPRRRRLALRIRDPQHELEPRGRPADRHLRRHHRLLATLGFHDVNAHSSEPYDPTDWESATTATAISLDRAVSSARRRTPTPCAGRPPTASGSTPISRRTEIALHGLRLFAAGSPAGLEFWATETAAPLFTDGFETGDTVGWSGKAGAHRGRRSRPTKSATSRRARPIGEFR